MKNNKKFFYAAVLLLALLILLWAQLQKPAARTAPAWVPRPVSLALPSLYLEDLTWLEVDAALQNGKTAILIPTGGTEQNGPHLVLGKHNKIVRYTSGQIAQALGNALAAPVLAYVPEGRISPAEGHMKFPGTISIPEDVFRLTLESAARSFAARGFKEIYFIGDSGGNQDAQKQAAENLSREFSGKGVFFHQVADYYSAANGQVALLKEQNETDSAIGHHAGIRDTSELLAVDPDAVRKDRLAVNGGGPSVFTGVSGDPTHASAERGQELLRLKIQAAVEEITKFRKQNGLK